MKSEKSRLTLLVLLGIVIVTIWFIPAKVLGQGEDQPVSSIQALTAAQINAVETYWTEERMRNAIPMPIPELSTSPTETQGAIATPSKPPVIAPSSDSGPITQSIPQEKIDELTGGAVESLAGTFPFSFTRYRLFPNTASMYKTYPYKATGKLFFTIPGQGNFVCSGSSINSTNNSVVWTAGHCVYTPGIGFNTNFLFVPARFQGNNPLGTWTTKAAFTTPEWTNGLVEYDHGALVTNIGGKKPKGTIGSKVGFLGFAANISRQQHWHLQGYPSGSPFDGEHLEICAAAWATDDQPTGTPGVDPQTIGVGCDQTGGTSGGAWVIDFSGLGGATNLLNGNISYRHTGPNPPENLKVFSPYFSDAAINLRNGAQSVPVP